LYVAGYSNFNSTITVASDTSLNSYLRVADDVSFNSNLYVAGSITDGIVSLASGALTGATTISATTLLLSGDASFNGSTYFDGDLSWNSANIPSGSIPASAIIGGVGSNTFTDDVSMNNGLRVDGDVSMNSGLYIAGGLTGATTISATAILLSGDASFNGGINVDGDISMNKGLYVEQTLIVNSDLSVNNSASITGQVNINPIVTSELVFTPGADWTQYGNIIEGYDDQPSNFFGEKVAMNDDGTIVAGSSKHSYGEGNDNHGVVKVYQYTDGSWNQLGQSIFGVNSGDAQKACALNGSGYILTVGSGIHNSYSGMARVFEYNSGSNTWVQLGSTINGTSEQLGHSIDINYSGDTIIVSGEGYNNRTGRYKIYKYSGGSWSLLGNEILGLSENEANAAVCTINDAGTIVAIGMILSNSGTGAARIYKYNASTNAWDKIGQDLLGPSINSYYGSSVALNSSGSIIVIGGYNYVKSGVSGSRHGLTEVFEYNEDTNNWNQLGSTIYGTADQDGVGYRVNINNTGDIMVIGSLLSTNAATHLGAGDVSIYRYVNNAWALVGSQISGEIANAKYGADVAINNNGTKVCFGNSGFKHPGGYAIGAVRVHDIDYSIVVTSTPLIVENDASFNGGFRVANDASFNNNIYIAGDITNATNITASVSIQGGTITDGTASLTGGNMTNLGKLNTSGDKVVLGSSTTGTTQSSGAIAIGYSAGPNQSTNAVAIGTNAGGGSGQASNTVAIGANAQFTGGNIPNDCVILNGQGSNFPIAGASTGGFFMKPIRGVAHGLGVGVIKYDTTTFEITYSTN
jgi:cytoskeletal protein CcmA (bactofilin family)